MKLSIIVPVYNAERWLERCVNSLLDQDIDKSEYEILLIDDGSTDGSLALAHQLATEAPNISVFTQPNAGPGAARNRGIDNSQGDYIMFVDADDYLKVNSLTQILNQSISSNLDLCFYRLLVLTPDTNFIGGNNAITTDICSGEYALLHGVSIGSACTCLFCRKLLVNHCIQFSAIINGEDTLFMTETIARAAKIKFSPEVIYMYDCTKEKSATQLQEMKKGKLLDCTFIAHKTHRLASIKDLSPRLRKFMHQRANSMIVSQSIDVLKHKKKYGHSFVSKYFNRLYSLNLYPIKGATLSWRTTLIVPILNIIKPLLPK